MGVGGGEGAHLKSARNAQTLGGIVTLDEPLSLHGVCRGEDKVLGNFLSTISPALRFPPFWMVYVHIEVGLFIGMPSFGNQCTMYLEMFKNLARPNFKGAGSMHMHAVWHECTHH